MKKILFPVLGIALVFSHGNVRASDVTRTVREFTATVKSYAPGRLVLYNKKNNHTYFHSYKITEETQISGIIRPGGEVTVSYYLKKVKRDHFVKIAVKIESAKQTGSAPEKHKIPLYSNPKDRYN